jgi:hypothetical protein
MGSLFALVSAGGSPGVTTTALALALGWPAPVIVAECDPGGGSVLAGALGGHVPAGVGLVEFAISGGQSPETAATALADQLVPLDSGHARMVLPGLTDPRQAAGLAAAWPIVAETLAAQSCDVIADCGRLDAGSAQPLPVLAAARTVAVVLRPTLRQIWAARPRIDMLAQLSGGTARLVVLITGEGTHPAREISATLGLPVAAVLPADPRSASVLSDGASHRRSLAASPLLTAANAAGRALRKHAAGLGAVQADAGRSPVNF